MDSRSLLPPYFRGEYLSKTEVEEWVGHVIDHVDTLLPQWLRLPLVLLRDRLGDGLLFLGWERLVSHALGFLVHRRLFYNIFWFGGLHELLMAFSLGLLLPETFFDPSLIRNQVRVLVLRVISLLIFHPGLLHGDVDVLLGPYVCVLPMLLRLDVEQAN